MIKEFKAQLLRTNNPKDILTLTALYHVYYVWCMDEEYNPLGKINFTKQLDLPKTTLGKNVTGYRGLKLSDDLEWYVE